jgi:hypothetical protein
MAGFRRPARVESGVLAVHASRYNAAMCDPKRDNATLWVWTGMAGLLLLYPVSFGPACWLANSDMISEAPVEMIYAPLIGTGNWLDCCGSGINPIRTYAGWFGEWSPDPFWYWSDSHFGPVPVIDPVEAAEDPFLKLRLLWFFIALSGRTARIAVR